MEPTATLRLPDARLLSALLRSIRDPGVPHQLCALVIADDGLTLRWEDESKAMQASIFLAPALFSQYDVPWAARSAGVRLHPLADALLVFTTTGGGASAAAAAAASAAGLAAPPSDLVLRSPGAGGAAALELASVEGSPGAIATAALLDGADPPATRDLAEGWAGPAASLVAPAGLLKEAVEDLEWGAAAGRGLARLTLSTGAAAAAAAAAGQPPHHHHHHPGPRAVLSAGPGPGGEAVEVDLPVSSLAEFRVGVATTSGSHAAATISHAYPYRLLRAALGAGAGKGGGGWGGGGGGDHHGALASAGGVTTKLAVDARGVLAVTHLVPVDGGGGGGGGSGSGAAGAPSSAVIKFVVVPSVEEEDGEEDGGDVYRGPRSGAAAG